MNLLTKLRNGSLSFWLQLYISDDWAVASWNIWNACMNFVLRSTHLQIKCGCSREYQLRTRPSHAMMKDLASATSSPPAEFTADSYLMRNCVVFPKLLYFGRETGLNLVVVVQFATQLRVVSLDPRIAKFHYPQNFFRGSSVLARVLMWWVLPQWTVSLFFHFFNFSLHFSICSFAWLSFSSFYDNFIFACNWFANLCFSFWSCCTF
jgi:hypothetical protein